MLLYLFGNLNYQPPAWYLDLKSKLSDSRFGQWWAARTLWAKAHPRQASIYTLGALVAACGAVYGVNVYRDYLASLPKPDYVTVQIEAPTVPDLETKKAKHLVVRFSKSASKIGALDRPVTAGISIDPKIKGTWKWASDSHLEFSPSEEAGEKAQWEIGRKYTVQMTRELFPDHVLLEELKYDFETPKLSGELTKNEFYQDPRDPRVKKAVFNFRFNYPIDTEDLKKRVSLKIRTKDDKVLGQKSKALSFTVSFNVFQNEVYIQSDALEIPKEDSIVEIEIDAGVRTTRGGSAEKLASHVDVPGLLNLFKFQNPVVTFARNEKFEPEQILVVESKAPVSTEAVAADLKLFLLPKKKKGEEKIRGFSRWQSASEVTAEVAAHLEPLPFKVVPAAEENSTTHTFKISAPAGRGLLLKLSAGLKSFGGYELAKNYEDVVRVPEFPKELVIMSQGALLSLSGDKKIPLLGRNITDAKFRLSRIISSQLNQFIYHNYSRGWGDFAKPNFEIPAETLAEIFTKDVKVPFTSAAASQYFSFDLDPYLAKDGGSKKGFFYVSVSSGGRSDQRVILITDLGIVSKTNTDKSHDVFVQNLKLGTPVAGADVDVIGTNGLTVLEAKTNAEGRANFPDLSEFKNEKKPIAFVVHHGADMSFLPYEMESRGLNFSQFDVGGLSENGAKDQLTAYMFSDRGIYRPGDAVNLGLMVRSRNWKKAFDGLPLFWVVTDPRGNEVHREKISVASKDLSSISFNTQETSATGVYTVQVYIAKKDHNDEQIGSLGVRVEEFLPDRMRVTTTLSKQTSQGWVTPDDLKANVVLKNLFGTAAEDRRVVGEMTLNPTPVSFRGFDGYRFAALKGDEKSFSEQLEPKQTDVKGEVTFELDLKRFNTGMYRLRFDAEGFEAKGGRGVAGTTSTLVSTWPFVVGLKPDGSLTYIPKGSPHSIDVVALDPTLKPMDQNEVKAVIVERKYVSSLVKQPDGTFKYQSVMKEIAQEPKALPVSAKGTKFKLPTDQPGDFVLVIKDKAELELNRLEYSVAGAANLSRSLEKNTELQLKLSRTDYKPGDEVELQIKAPFTGAGLITIERDRVYTSKWFKTSTTSTIEHIKIPEGVEGNAYVNVTFLRASDSKEIFMSPLAYAVVPFSISLDEHKIDVKIDVPEKVRPGQTMKVGYTATRPTKIILYGVDEGILQVSKYKLPDPLTYFFQRRALQVKTFQLLDLLLPEYSVIKGLSAPGGDGEGAISRNLNPFKRKTEKPVVFWSGVIDAGPGKKEFTYDVPDYFNGSIRVMAVTSNGAAFGAHEEKTLSRGDFVITSNVPTFVTPGDEFVVGVGLSNQAEGTGDTAQVKLEIQAEAFDVVGEKVQTLVVPEGREKAAEFRLKAKNKLGSQPILFRASAGGKSAKASVETSIRPAVPYVTDLVAGYAEKPIFEIPATRKLLPEFSHQTAALSPAPLVMGESLKGFLDEYPYGCSEQLTSKLIPYVFLKGRSEFKVEPKKAKEMFEKLSSQLLSRQTPSGGFAMYDPAHGEDAAVSLYVIFAMLEAKDRGFAVPTEILERALGFLESGFYRKVSTISEARAFAESLYLMAKAGRVPGNDVSFLRKALDKKFKDIWRTDVTAGYLGATYKILKQDDEARAVVSKLVVGAVTTSDFNYFYDGMTRDTQVLTLFARHFPELLKERANDQAVRKAFEPLRAGLFNTHTAAWSIIALDALVANAQVAENLKELGIDEIREKGVAQALSLPANTSMPLVTFTNQAEKIRYKVPAGVPYYFAQRQAGFDLELPKQEIKKNLEMTREFLNEAGQPITAAKLGETVQVRLRVRSTLPGRQPHLVIVDLLPSGLEPVLEKQVTSSESDEVGEGSRGKAERESEGEGEGGDGGDGYDGDPNGLPPDGPGDADILESMPPTQDGGDGALNDLFHYFIPAAYAEDAVTSKVSPLLPDYVERREDRMIVYTWLEPGVREFVYRARAVSEGTFVVPPAFAESMYDHGIQYRGTASQFKIEPQK